MVGTKIKLLLGLGVLAIALLGIGLGRMTSVPAEAADKKLTPLAAPPSKTEARDGQPTKPEPDAEAKAETAVVPGNDLVVRRPLGSYTKEVPAYGKATLTFSENRLRIHANVRLDDLNFTVAADGDYNLNRESMVYGIITGIDVSGLALGKEAAELGLLAATLHDTPFAFRIRVDDDAMAIKDLKFGPFGSLLFADRFGNGDGAKEMLMIAGIVGGKYKADPNPERNSLPMAPPRGNQPALKLKK